MIWHMAKGAGGLPRGRRRDDESNARRLRDAGLFLRDAAAGER